jgi:uncharacterized protein
MHINRVYLPMARRHFQEDRQMLFLSGPRQVGKTTTARALGEQFPDCTYLNWDVTEHRRLIMAGGAAVAEAADLHRARDSAQVLILDEIHKMPGWKDLLKGLFDGWAPNLKIVVTGSAHLNVFKKGGDSLMGRYFPYRMHPLSVGEICSPAITEGLYRARPQAPAVDDFAALLRYGGFPEPYIRRQPRFHQRWRRLRTELLIKEDLRDLSRTTEVARIEVLASIMAQRAGQLTSFASLSRQLGVSIDTVKSWLAMLEALHYLFPVRPWHENLSRALRKEPKYYLWDWSDVDSEGARLENLVACALLKSVHFWTDTGMGNFALHYIRDKEKHEVDFVVVRDGSPWFLVEVKSSRSKRLTPSLARFQEQTAAPHAFQAVLDLEPIASDCFSYHSPTVVPLVSFLSQLI